MWTICIIQTKCTKRSHCLIYEQKSDNIYIYYKWIIIWIIILLYIRYHQSSNKRQNSTYYTCNLLNNYKHELYRMRRQEYISFIQWMWRLLETLHFCLFSCDFLFASSAAAISLLLAAGEFGPTSFIWFTT